MTYAEITGHPTVEATRDNVPPTMITVCANCEALKSVLYLSTDRWFCSKCKSSGDARPTQVPLFNPKRKRGR